MKTAKPTEIGHRLLVVLERSVGPVDDAKTQRRLARHRRPDEGEEVGEEESEDEANRHGARATSVGGIGAGPATR